MADTKISDLTEISTAASGDEFVVVDKSDTTFGAAGTNKKITLTSVISSGSIVTLTGTQTLTNKTLTTPTITNPTLSGSGGTLTLPAGPDTLVGRATTDTLTNKTLTSPTLTSAVVATSLDMNGTELILDSDGDTSITADTDNQIDIRIAGADDFQFTANQFEVLSGSTLLFTGNAVAANGVAYRAKQAGGTAVDLMHLGSNDQLRLAQISRQDITTNSVLEDVLIQHGWTFDQPGAASGATTTITFDEAYSSLPIVIVGNLGLLDGSDPTEIDDFITNKGKLTTHAYTITTTTFKIEFRLGDGTNFGANERVGASWIALGVKT